EIRSGVPQVPATLAAGRHGGDRGKMTGGAHFFPNITQPANPTTKAAPTHKAAYPTCVRLRYRASVSNASAVQATYPWVSSSRLKKPGTNAGPRPLSLPAR